MGTKPSMYERIGTVRVEEVVVAAANLPKGEYRGSFHGHSVSLTGLRMKTFLLKGTSCSVCGIPAAFFAVERHRKRPVDKNGYHLNLWGVSKWGHPVLFTHDHTIARGNGGSDTIDNTTTMCDHCNSAKATAEFAYKNGTPEEIRLRKDATKARREAVIAKRMETDPAYAARVIEHERIYRKKI